MVKNSHLKAHLRRDIRSRISGLEKEIRRNKGFLHSWDVSLRALDRANLDNARYHVEISRNGRKKVEVEVDYRGSLPDAIKKAKHKYLKSGGKIGDSVSPSVTLYLNDKPHFIPREFYTGKNGKELKLFFFYSRWTLSK